MNKTSACMLVETTDVPICLFKGINYGFECKTHAVLEFEIPTLGTTPPSQNFALIYGLTPGEGFVDLCVHDLS